MNIPKKTMGADWGWISELGKAGGNIITGITGGNKTTAPAPQPSIISSLMPLLIIGGVGLLGFAIINKKK